MKKPPVKQIGKTAHEQRIQTSIIIALATTMIAAIAYIIAPILLSTSAYASSSTPQPSVMPNPTQPPSPTPTHIPSTSPTATYTPMPTNTPTTQPPTRINSSPELAWISIIGGFVGAIGGFVAIVATIINLVIIWRNRRRIEFHPISANIYYEPWRKWELEGVYWPGPPPGIKPGIKEGDCKRAFIVVEFALKNEYPTEVTVGRFMIDGWMFSNRYSPYMYAPKRDYRVFDLYTRTPTSLEAYKKLAPKSSYGLQIEILEETEGPHYKGSHSRYVVDLPTKYIIEFHTDVGRQRQKVKFPRPQEAQEAWNELALVHRWSDDLLGPSRPSSAGAPLPQTIQYPKYQTPWRGRLRNWYRKKLNWLLYGTSYRLPGQPNRLSQAIQAIKAKRLRDSTNERPTQTNNTNKE